MERGWQPSVSLSLWPSRFSPTVGRRLSREWIFLDWDTKSVTWNPQVIDHLDRIAFFSGRLFGSDCFYNISRMKQNDLKQYCWAPDVSFTVIRSSAPVQLLPLAVEGSKYWSARRTIHFQQHSILRFLKKSGKLSMKEKNRSINCSQPTSEYMGAISISSEIKWSLDFYTSRSSICLFGFV